jgi:hypothetical protein
MTLTEQVEKLNSLLPQLGTSDKSFAADLISSFYKYKGLTAKQQPWIGKLIERAALPKVEKAKVDVGGFQGVISLFNTAKQHLKSPKIVLSCKGLPIILSVAGPTSKAPGSVNIVGEGSFTERPWYGRVSPEGLWEPSFKAEAIKTELTELLQKLSQNPARVAKEHGKLTGNCCFCNSKLEDKRSTAAGFGPVCAAHYGLKEEWKTAVKKAEEQEAVLAETLEVKEETPSSLCPICDKKEATKDLDGARICEDCFQELSVLV